MTFRCAAFDFDGTLVDSNAIKREAFFWAVRERPGAEEILREILAGPNSGTRYEVFAALAARVAPPREAAALGRRWAEAYTQHCEEAIAAAREIMGARACLDALRARGVALYINSATPEAPLQRVVARRGLGDLFAGIYGAPAGKVENLERICVDAGCTAQQLVLVGDGDADREAAAVFACRFIAIGASGVTDLREIPGMIFG